jgi:hypothetical protein
MVADITVADITVADITPAAIMVEAITVEVTPASIGVCTSIGTCACTKIDPPTSTTSWAGRITATSGSAGRGTVGAAVGMPTVWALAGFMLTACGSGIPSHARYEGSNPNDGGAALTRLFGLDFLLNAHVVA